VVDDGRTRRLQQHARRSGFPELRSYLQARDAGHQGADWFAWSLPDATTEKATHTLDRLINQFG
jgi:hypothetical protein